MKLDTSDLGSLKLGDKYFIIQEEKTPKIISITKEISKQTKNDTVELF